ncbi:uncharacterized protein LOC144148693 [Haemaphysalis longicornis]
MMCLPAAFVAVIFATFLDVSMCGTVKDEKTPTYYTFCFWDRLSEWRPAPYNFKVSDIPAELCDAVIYSHVTIDHKTGRIKLTSQELKLDPDARAKGSSPFYNWIWLLPPHRVFSQMKQLKHRNPKLKIFLAIGGPKDPSEKYWKYSPEIHLWRDTAASLAQWLRTYEFDGVVFDFFSGSTIINDSSRTWDQAKLILPFIREISRKFLDYPQNWRIALTIPVFDRTTHHLFDIKRLNEVVNFFILKTSDCAEVPKAPGLNVTRKIDMTDIERAEFLVEKGALRQSIVLDIPFSGQTYTTTNSDLTSVFKGRSGPHTKTQGSMAFYEVCDHIKSGWKWERYGEEACSFLNLGNEYVAYEDERSIQRKARMVMGMQYRGAAVRTVDVDDITGTCTRKSYLLKALREQLDERTYYVHFHYNPRNTTWSNKTNDGYASEPTGSFTQPAMTYAASVSKNSHSTTAIPPTTRVFEGPGVPQRSKPFLPGFYALTSSSTNLPLSTAKPTMTTKPPVSKTTPTLDATHKEPESNISWPEPHKKSSRLPGDTPAVHFNENQTSPATPSYISTFTTAMSKDQQRAKTSVCNAKVETTAPFIEDLRAGHTSTPESHYSRGPPIAEVATSSTEKSRTTSTTETIAPKETITASSSLIHGRSHSPEILESEKPITPEGISLSTTQNILMHSVSRKPSTSRTSTIDYETTTLQSVQNTCKVAYGHVLVPHETDCRKFYQCANSIPHLKSCPPKTVFDNTWQVCNWPNLVNRPECKL